MLVLHLSKLVHARLSRIGGFWHRVGTCCKLRLALELACVVITCFRSGALCNIGTLRHDATKITRVVLSLGAWLLTVEVLVAIVHWER